MIDNHSGDLAVSEARVRIRGWPTDTLTIDHRGNSDSTSTSTSSREDEAAAAPHTLLLFIPGNPGVVHWYADLLVRIVERLGRGYASRGVSYAGHGVGDDVVGTEDDHGQSFHGGEKPGDGNGEATREEGDRPKDEKDMSVPWTMEGQINHKIEWVDGVIDRWRERHGVAPNLVFVSHSIGAHFVQCVLLRRPDVLARTRRVIHLMPFFRFDPPPLKRLFLSSAAKSYKFTIPAMKNLVRALSYALPRNWVDAYLEKVVGLDCAKGRRIALDVFMHPNMVKNHLVLGMQEVRELPEHPNDVALRLIGVAPTSILFCGGPDQWAPQFHMEELRRMQQHSIIPNNIRMEYIEELRHDFVVHREQIDPVVTFCVQIIKSEGKAAGLKIKSRL